MTSSDPAPAEVGVHEAKTHLSRLLVRVGHGEEIVITNRGREVGRLVPPRTRRARRLGMERGTIHIGDDFDAPLPDEFREAFGL